ncbi:hypothetical protein CFP56_015148 [Quercus suber]|uniref:Uncharacterized protein n=1 Tax=Quercus suber TaxID=58331 RepID=A0AAW0KS40_QUESU
MQKRRREDLPLPSLFEQARKFHSIVADSDADQRFGKRNWVAATKRVKGNHWFGIGMAKLVESANQRHHNREFV